MHQSPLWEEEKFFQLKLTTKQNLDAYHKKTLGVTNTTELIPTFWNTGDTLPAKSDKGKASIFEGTDNKIICIPRFKPLKQESESLQKQQKQNKFHLQK